MEALSQPVVIDNGSGFMKAGFAGKESPDCVFSSCVGTPKHHRVLAGGLQGNKIVGKEVQKNRGLLRLQYPMAHGIVEDWDDMTEVWRHVFQKELKVMPEEHPVLLTEAPLNAHSNRRQAAEILFERFHVPALYVSVQALLALYATGRTTGVVLDCGDGVSQCVPVYDGFVIPHAVTRTDVAGRDVTDYLQLLLRRAGFPFNTSAEFELVREIKERECYVSKVMRSDATVNTDTNKSQHVLPDGQVIALGRERTMAPEILFRPDRIGSESPGVSTMITQSIMKCDIDLRQGLYEQVVLSGGSTMFQGFGERLLHELQRQGPKYVNKIRIHSSPDSQYLTWMGGSILANLDSFKKIWVTRQEWDEEKENVLFRKMQF